MKHKNIGSDKILRSFIFVLMFAFGITFAFILIWMVLSSFRSVGSFSRSPFNFFDFNFNSLKNNYIKAFTYKVGGTTNMYQMIANTLILVTGCTLLQVLIPSICGYIVAKYKFKLKLILVNIAVITMVVPTIGSVTATYRFIYNLGLLDKFAGVFLLYSGGIGFGFLMFKNFFSSIPWEFAESAFIDGASDFKTFLLIMAPQAKSIFIAIAIMSFIANWNDYYTPYLYLRSHPTIAYGLNAIYSKYTSNLPVVFAAMTFTTVVVLILYVFFGKTIMESMSAGGLKG